MNTHEFVEFILFIGIFFTVASLLQVFVEKVKFPYTVALLILGFFVQYLSRVFHIPIHAELTPDFIFFFLLPILLFGAAMHIRLHQFKLQFKTIAFAATFGLLLSILIVGLGTTWLLGLPIEGAFLFGALISATDPIAVLAIFKTLGAPKRLSLLADGESMFNDATAVILFRILITIVSGATVFSSYTLVEGVEEFFYVFFGSIAAGLILGYGVSWLVSKINNYAVEMTLTIGAALIAFTGAEYFFHLSGVITSVIAGLVVGNMGRSRFSPSVAHFISELWEYLGYLAVSVVFFFATFSLDTTQFLYNPTRWMLAIGIVIVARSISTYLTYAISNVLPLFKDEPTVPLNWQHVLNWGGLRGVIPLVLVFSIPDSVWYKEDLTIFTFAVLLFSLFVNGLTIKYLLKFLGLNITKKEVQIAQIEKDIFRIEKAKNILASLPSGEFNITNLNEMDILLKNEEALYKKQLDSLVTVESLEKSLRLEFISLQREHLESLFWQGYVSENVMLEFDARLDLLEDALEYPEVYNKENFRSKSRITERELFRKQLSRVRRIMRRLPFIKRLLFNENQHLVTERFYLLKARIITSREVLKQIERLVPLFAKEEAVKVLKSLQEEHEIYIVDNTLEIKELRRKYGKWIDECQQKLLRKLIHPINPSFID
ncbi:MAG: hypothetical protein COU63_00015 [Candidatus Pacebacteria bacterium CG10_big_fil_rev_8_21_14_0_10_36_11]|nr:sodium:proton antiporter [Candidatus Pacearchaeota archaeon]OIP74148.1 MAG: hypothetical protein AUK08_02765 [Candidatus Pacebacteria bacterium CG2_30_36_39]PIR65051.1 MAG: hypothetical protein COU63_00015 [Candidatus Pacebacteria bacterium CG10_big_fil_rev_8_21_14_0_10_36_11]